MLGVHVTVPVACFRKGMAREYLETERLPPPSTCYGFLLSLVGETDRTRHIGVRLSPVLVRQPHLSVVLRTVWRVKKLPLGSKGNTRPDYQQLLTGVELVLWIDSSEEAGRAPRLESRVRKAIDRSQRGELTRFGGLSLGESTHLVDTVSILTEDRRAQLKASDALIYELAETGLLALPVWVDHVGSAGTAYSVGNLRDTNLSPPSLSRMPRIAPND